MSVTATTREAGGVRAAVSTLDRVGAGLQRLPLHPHPGTLLRDLRAQSQHALPAGAVRDRLVVHQGERLAVDGGDDRVRRRPHAGRLGPRRKPPQRVLDLDPQRQPRPLKM